MIQDSVICGDVIACSREGYESHLGCVKTRSCEPHAKTPRPFMSPGLVRSYKDREQRKYP